MSRTGTASPWNLAGNRCRRSGTRPAEAAAHLSAVAHASTTAEEEQQRPVLKDAEENDLLEAYESALAQRDRQLAGGQAHA